MGPLSGERLLRLRARSDALPRGPETFYFQSGREAFLALLRAVKSDNSTVALIPSYAPEGLYAPIVAQGWAVRLYPIGENLTPDWQALETLFRDQTPAVAVLIHHFGIAQDTKHFVELCRRYGVVAVEDLAHVAPLPTSTLGALADVALISFPKMYGVADGAALKLNSATARKLAIAYDERRASFAYVISQTGALLSTSVAALLPKNVGNVLRKVSGRLFRGYELLMAGFRTVRPASEISKWVLAHTDRQAEAEQRIRHAQLYHDHLDKKRFRPIAASIADDHGMFGYPVLIENRNGFVNYMAQYQISGTVLTSRWDFRQDVGYDHQDGTSKILREHFLFPLVGRLSTTEIIRIIELANNWDNASASE